jgi:hypothetical protein
MRKQKFDCEKVQLPKNLKRFSTGYYVIGTTHHRKDTTTFLGKQLEYETFCLRLNYKDYNIEILEIDKLEDGTFMLWNNCTGFKSHHKNYSSAILFAHEELTYWFTKELGTTDFFLTL